MKNYCIRKGRDCYGESELPLLFGITSLLNRSKDIKDVMLPILELISIYIRVKRSMITILNRDLSQIFIDMLAI